jgi:hypothetical protein
MDGIPDLILVAEVDLLVDLRHDVSRQNGGGGIFKKAAASTAESHCADLNQDIVIELWIILIRVEALEEGKAVLSCPHMAGDIFKEAISSLSITRKVENQAVLLDNTAGSINRSCEWVVGLIVGWEARHKKDVALERILFKDRIDRSSIVEWSEFWRDQRMPNPIEFSAAQNNKLRFDGIGIDRSDQSIGGLLPVRRNRPLTPRSSAHDKGATGEPGQILMHVAGRRQPQ